jgi:osmotically-inducible protein OsmY
MMHKPNDILEKDVHDELDWDSSLDDSQIIVKADNGRVTLTGAVPSYIDVLDASDDAWVVSGVTTVDNQLLVGPAGELIADEDVAVECVAAIDSDRLVPHGAVSVDVVDGWVTLTGRVRRHFQRQAAKYAVARAKGVRGVTDNVQISGDPIPSDVADRINKAFARKAILTNSVIQVTNSGSTVYLDGTTDSPAAMLAAEHTAWDAPGVTDVVDRLLLIP